jgi:hypothetical protein
MIATSLKLAIFFPQMAKLSPESRQWMKAQLLANQPRLCVRRAVTDPLSPVGHVYCLIG